VEELPLRLCLDEAAVHLARHADVDVFVAAAELHEQLAVGFPVADAVDGGGLIRHGGLQGSSVDCW
jgi:hypothetical protein